MFKKIKTLSQIIKVVKNWPTVILGRFNLLNEKEVLFRNKQIFLLRKGRDNWNKLMTLVRFYNSFPDAKVGNGEVDFIFRGLNLKLQYGDHDLDMIQSIFGEEEYRELTEADIRNKTVVDIGAAIGDTALYFMSRGASKVISFELFPYSYDLACKNIYNNNFKEAVIINNVGVDGRAGVVKIDPEYKNSFGDSIDNCKNEDQGRSVRITTLDDIVEEFNPQQALLKVDCEGCEQAIILNSKEDSLNRFSTIVLDYDKGYKKIKNRLEGLGFKVELFPSRSTINNKEEDQTGIILARKDIKNL